MNKVDEGYIGCKEGEDPLVKMAEHYAELGCKEFCIEDGRLYLRWPDGKEQMVTLDSCGTLQ